MAAGDSQDSPLTGDTRVMTERQQQVLQAILTQPDATLQEIAEQIGVTRERVRQVYERLRDAGLQVDRKAQRKEILEKKKQGEITERERKKQMWRKMMFIGLRQRLRFMAHIDHRGMVRGYHMPGEEAVCQFEMCTRPVRARGFCHLHYFHLRKTGALWVRRSSRYLCKETGCYVPVYARDLCQAHYEAWRRKNPITSHLPAHNTSGYRGVTKAHDYDGWIANIRNPTSGKMEYLGGYKSKERAARAYDTAARKYHGEQAILNFPDEHIEITKEIERQSRSEKPSGQMGVTWDKNRHRWQVKITHNKKTIFVGRFIDLDEAVQARNTALKEAQK